MITSRPVIFISAVSRELRSTRDLVAKTLIALGYEPKWQDIAPTETGDLRAVLRKWVDESHAVLQIVGHRYGHGSREPDETFGPVSYTQYEALYAKAKGKKVWYIILDEHHPTDCPDDEPEDLKKLQADYRIQVKAHHGLYHHSPALLTTENIVLKLRDDLAKLRRRGKQLATILIALFSFALGGIGWMVLKQKDTGEKVARIDTRTSATDQKVDSVLSRYKQMEQALISLADAESRSHLFGEKLSREEVRERAYALLEKELGLASGTLAKELPGFALELYGRPDTSLLMRARAAYALNKFAEAEKLFLESEAKDRQAHENAEKAADNLRKQRIEALAGAGQSAAGQIQYKRALEHYRAAAALTSEERGVLEWAEVQCKIGWLLGRDGQYNSQATLMHRAWQACEKAGQRESPISLRCHYLWADALDSEGKYAEAEKEFQAVLAIQERVLGQEYSDTLESRGSIAQALGNQGKYAEAEKENRAVLAIRERVLGPEHPDTLESRNNLAVVLQNQHKYAEAEQEQRAVLAIEERVLGPEHPSTLTSRSNLTFFLYDQRKDTEAEQEYRAVLAIQERVLGPEHPSTLNSRANLANIMLSQGKYAEAEKERRAVLAIQERVLGPEHPSTLHCRRNLADVLEFHQGRHAEAEQEYRAVLAIQERVLGSEHPEVSYSLFILMRSLDSAGKKPETLEIARRVLELARRDLAEKTKVLGAQHPETLKCKDWVERFEPYWVEPLEHPNILCSRMNLANAIDSVVTR